MSERIREGVISAEASSRISPAPPGTKERGLSLRPNPTVISWSILALLGLVAPFVLSGFATYQLTLAFAFAICITGITLTTGGTGVINIGAAAFFGIGAYSMLIASDLIGGIAYWAIPVGALVAGVVGVIVGFPIARLTGWNAALLTIGVAVAFPPIVQRFSSVTGGSQGLYMARPVSPVTWLSGDQWIYLVAFGVLALCLFLRDHLGRRLAGATMTATRDGEVVARALGVNTTYVKVVSFALGSMFAAIGGSVHGLANQFAEPQSFTVLMSITFLLGFVIGGTRLTIGPVIGGLFIEYGRIMSESVFQKGINLVFGLTLIALMYLAPDGLPDVPHRIASALRSRRKPLQTGRD